MNGHRTGQQLLQGPSGPSESLLGRRRQIQQQQQQHDQLQKMMTMMRRNPESTAAPASHNYVQRLSVQLPQQKRTADNPAGHRRPQAAAAAADDVLRFVIHVEETDEEEAPKSPSPALRHHQHQLRRKISWHEESRPNRPGHRKMLKHIGRQRSASLETSCAARLAAHDDEGTRSGRLTAPLSTAPHSGSGAHTVVKEFRRSSELLRNILMSLSSRRSSDSSASNSNNRLDSSNPYLSGYQSHGASPVSGIGVPAATAEAPDLQAALQAHRKRRWMTCDSSPIAAEPASSNTLNCGGGSKLFEAIASGNLCRTRQLLESGADPNACNDYGYTALHWCTVQTPVPWSSILELLEHGCRVEQRDKDGTQPVFLVPNLPRIQQQLVSDAVDYLRKAFAGDLPPKGPEGEDGCGHSGGIGDSSGAAGGGGGGSGGGVGGGTVFSAYAGQKAAGNIFRRLQASANTKKLQNISLQQQQQLQQHPQQQHPLLTKNKSKDQQDCPPEMGDSNRGFEITSIKVM